MKDVSANLLIFGSNNFHSFLVRKNEFFVHSARKRQHFLSNCIFYPVVIKKNKNLSQNLKTGNGKQDLSLTRFTFTFILQSFPGNQKWSENSVSALGAFGPDCISHVNSLILHLRGRIFSTTKKYICVICIFRYKRGKFPLKMTKRLWREIIQSKGWFLFDFASAFTAHIRALQKLWTLALYFGWTMN